MGWNSYRGGIVWEPDWQRKLWARYWKHEWFAWVDELDEDGYAGEDKEFWRFWTSIMSYGNTMDVKVYHAIVSDVREYRHLETDHKSQRSKQVISSRAHGKRQG